MKLHEYQAKQLLSKFGVNIPPGEVVYQTHEAENIVTWLNEEKIKALKKAFMLESSTKKPRN